MKQILYHKEVKHVVPTLFRTKLPEVVRRSVYNHWIEVLPSQNRLFCHGHIFFDQRTTLQATFAWIEWFPRTMHVELC